jgi:hypothetical protein
MPFIVNVDKNILDNCQENGGFCYDIKESNISHHPVFVVGLYQDDNGDYYINATSYDIFNNYNSGIFGAG